MTAYEIYCEMEEKLENIENENVYDKEEDKLIEFRDTNFLKADWEQLIANACSGRAKYEYTKLMNEKFPE